MLDDQGSDGLDELMNRSRSTLKFVVGAQGTVIVLLLELAARDHVTIRY